MNCKKECKSVGKCSTSSCGGLHGGSYVFLLVKPPIETFHFVNMVVSLQLKNNSANWHFLTILNPCLVHSTIVLLQPYLKNRCVDNVLRQVSSLTASPTVSLQ